MKFTKLISQEFLEENKDAITKAALGELGEITENDEWISITVEGKEVALNYYSDYDENDNLMPMRIIAHGFEEYEKNGKKYVQFDTSVELKLITLKPIDWISVGFESSCGNYRATQSGVVELPWLAERHRHKSKWELINYAKTIDEAKGLCVKHKNKHSKAI